MSPNQAAALILSIYTALTVCWFVCWRELSLCKDDLRRAEEYREWAKEELKSRKEAIRNREDLIFLLQNKLARLESPSAATTDEVTR